MKKITIKDIARQAGVSCGTVSKIITGKYKEDNIHLSEITIQNVQKIIKELNYKSTYSKKSKEAQKTFIIGIYMPKSINPNFTFGHYYSEILNNIKREAKRQGYDILIINNDMYIDKFEKKQIDGVIIIEQQKVDRNLNYLITEKKPCVIINNLMEEDLNIFSINLDNYEGVKNVVRHFKENNHKDLAFIGELIPTPQKEHIWRLEYFKTILKSENLNVNEGLFLLNSVNGITKSLLDYYYDQMSGFYGMQYLWEKHKGQFTGVFCANDIIALGAIHYLYKKEIKVPEDVSIIGFDDVDFAAHLIGGLTTIKLPVDRIGAEAFSWLLKFIDKEVDINFQTIKIAPKLIVRNSVARL